jgi:hypothetical protein
MARSVVDIHEGSDPAISHSNSVSVHPEDFHENITLVREV